MQRITAVTTAPTEEPVSLFDVLSHLRVTESDEEQRISQLITSARQDIEHRTNRAMRTQTRTVAYPRWPSGDVIEIPFPPIQSVTHVKYTDTDGTEYTLSTDDYSVDTDAEPGRIVLGYGETWPSETLHDDEFPIVITYVCGYTAGNVPQVLQDAIKFQLELLYDRPQDQYAGQLERTIKSLIAPYRVWTF